MGKKYGDENKNAPLAERFQTLLVKANEQTGKRAVVLVDEYDKSLTDTINDINLLEHNKAVFKGFFSTLKSYDRYLEFVFLTGVTKFSKVSIFSDLNQLMDISITERYSGICGITEKELRDNFLPEIEAMAQSNRMTTDECFAELKRMYDGYHFFEESEGVYNPFSLLNALDQKKFLEYWFSTGTPTVLVEKLKSADFDAKKFTEGTVYANGNILSDYRADNPDPILLLYQSGYLTITDYDARKRRYTLGYPNDEVKYSFIESLAPLYLHDKSGTSGMDIFSIEDYIDKGDTDSLRDAFISLFSRLPYTTDEKPVEQNFQNVIYYIVFMLLGQYVHTEIHSAKGRADCIVETDEYVYIFEFKRDGSADEALRQTEDMGYDKPYASDKRTLIRIGANFDSKERTISEWKVA